MEKSNFNSQIFNWVTRHIGTVFSILGVVATIYFGVFHIPGYLQEMKNEKIRNTHTDLIQNVQEIVFSDSIKLNFQIVETLINSKELKSQIEYPYSANQLLGLVQESFMEQKYLPLNERQKLFEELEVVKNRSEPSIPVEKHKVLKSRMSILGILIALVSVLVSVLGLIAVYRNKRREIEKEEEEKVREIGTFLKHYTLFDKTISNILKDVGHGLKFSRLPSKEFWKHDFEVSDTNKTLFGWIKYLYREGLSDSYLRWILTVCQMSGKSGIVILNREITQAESELVEKINNTGNTRIDIIAFKDGEQLMGNIKSIIKDN